MSTKPTRPLSVFAPADIPLLKRTIISAIRKDKIVILGKIKHNYYTYIID